jgi:hypothetical protein
MLGYGKARQWMSHCTYAKKYLQTSNRPIKSLTRLKLCFPFVSFNLCSILAPIFVYHRSIGISDCCSRSKSGFHSHDWPGISHPPWLIRLVAVLDHGCASSTKSLITEDHVSIASDGDGHLQGRCERGLLGCNWLTHRVECQSHPPGNQSVQSCR